MSKGKHAAEKENKIKRKKNKKNRKISKVLRKIFIILFIISVTYIIIFFWNSKREQKETDELLNTIDVTNVIEEETTEPKETERMLKVRELQKDYPDVKAWIEIEGTNVNYPVMQGEDNDFYMDHNYKKESSKRGSIFLDKDYDWSIPSSNLLMYGHNNSKDGTMFADLLKYKKESYYKEHPTIKFTTAEEDAEYDIIAVFLSRLYYKSEKNVFRYYFFLNAENEEEYNDYVKNSKKASLYDTGKTAKYGDQLITLSTCEYSQEDGRLAVVARKNKLQK